MSVNNRKPPESANWRDRPIERWNCTTFSAFLVDLTREKFGVEYEPTGGGSKASKWSREKGMLKQAQGKYGNAVLRRFIEICIDQYAPKPQYPYASFTFMYSYMSDRFPKAQADISAQNRRAKMTEEAKVNELSDGEFDDWI